MIVPSRNRIVSRISEAVATIARAARSALRRAVSQVDRPELSKPSFFEFLEDDELVRLATGGQPGIEPSEERVAQGAIPGPGFTPGAYSQRSRASNIDSNPKRRFKKLFPVRSARGAHELPHDVFVVSLSAQRRARSASISSNGPRARQRTRGRALERRGRYRGRPATGPPRSRRA